MSNIKDVEVIITRETAALTQQGFGLPFILATNDFVEYNEYTGIEEVAEDYPVGTTAYDVASRIFGQTPKPAMIAMAGIEREGTDPSELVAYLNELVELKNDWYFLYSDVREKESIKALSAWIDTQKKLYFFDSDDLEIIKELESDRTIYMYHNDTGQHPAAGWIGRCAPELPGSITWKFKTVNGVLAADIRTSDLNQLHKDGGNTYINKVGVLQSSEGKATSGEYIDVMRSQDFIDARLTEEVSRVLYTQKKVAYESGGIALLVDAATSVMKRATEQGIVLKDEAGNGLWSITARTRQESSKNDVANRVYDGIEIFVPLAGAVHSAVLRVTLYY